eukprot:3429073-Rhodomonas_salina.1
MTSSEVPARIMLRARYAMSGAGKRDLPCLLCRDGLINAGFGTGISCARYRCILSGMLATRVLRNVRY